MLSRTHHQARSEKEGLFLWGLQIIIKNPQRKRKMNSGSFAICSHGRGQQSGDQREPGQHVIMTVSAIRHLAIGSLHSLGPHCSVWSADQQHWHCPGASQNAECRSHLELLKQNLHFNQTSCPPPQIPHRWRVVYTLQFAKCCSGPALLNLDHTLESPCKSTYAWVYPQR